MCVTVAVLLLAGVGLAQDPVKVDPKHHKVEFEDNQVRVLRITFPPGEKSVTHSHPNAVAVFLTESTLRQNVSAGNAPQGPRKAGDVVWAEPFTHTRKQAESGCPRNPFDGHCASFRIYRKMVWTILRYTR
jgi:quercetin dioxygenase-like cupin family protein